MKYNKKDYLVRDNRLCSKLIDICFVPFSGNGQNICRLFERGLCPPEEVCKNNIRLYKILKKKNKQKQKQKNKKTYSFLKW